MALSPAARRLATTVSESTAFAGLVGLLERASRWPPNRLAVLTYHRVDDPLRHPELHPGLLSATPADFDAQMRFLASTCRVIGAKELLEALRRGVELPPRAVMVTFDDAYRDFAGVAWPILERHGLPVTLFVATAYPDRPERAFWWDRLHSGLSRTRRTAPLDTPIGPLPIATLDERTMTFRRLRDYVKTVPHHDVQLSVDDLCRQLGASPPVSTVLGWEELRRLARAGVTLAPHSREHPMLDRLPVDEARSEVEGSMADLVREVGPTPAVFAYPSGQYDERVVEVVRAAGFDAAFTTGRGTNDLATADSLRLRRINVGRRTTLALLRAQLLPAAARLNRSNAAAGAA